MLRYVLAASLFAVPAFGATISINGSDSVAFGESWRGGPQSLVSVSASDCAPICATIDYYNAVNLGPGFTISTIVDYVDERITAAWQLVVDTTTNVGTGTNDVLRMFGVSLPQGYTITGTMLDQPEDSWGQIVLSYSAPSDPDIPDGPLPAPLPASGLILATALGALAIRRRRR